MFTKNLLALVALAVAFAAMPAHAQDKPAKAEKYWQEECVDTKAGKKCVVSQTITVTNKDNNETGRLAKFSVGTGDDKSFVSAVLPLGIHLVLGGNFTIDGKEPGIKLIPIFCMKDGCQARGEITAADIAAMKKGNDILIRVLPIGAEKAMGIPVKLKGFTKAYNTMLKTMAN